jgi:hypothetical protein
VTQSSSADPERSQLKAGMRPWEPPSLSTVLAVVESSPEDAPFVFHDPAGRRWSRIKRGVAIAAAAVVVVGAGVLVALTRVAPGRAPAFAGAPTQQVPDWQVRGGGASGAGSVPSVADGQGTAAATRSSTATTAPSSATSGQPSAKPSRRPTATPRHTPLPPTPTA